MKIFKRYTYDLCILLCILQLKREEGKFVKTNKKYQRVKKKTDSIWSILLPK